MCSPERVLSIQFPPTLLAVSPPFPLPFPAALPPYPLPAPHTPTPFPLGKRSARPIRPRSIRYGGSALGGIWAGGGGLLSAGRAVRAVQVATRGRKRPACPSFTFGAAHPHPHSPTPPYLAVPPHVRCAALRSIGGLPPPLPLRTDGAGFAAPVLGACRPLRPRCVGGCCPPHPPHDAAGVAAALARLPRFAPAQGGREKPCRPCWCQSAAAWQGFPSAALVAAAGAVGGSAAGAGLPLPVMAAGCFLSDVGHRILIPMLDIGSEPAFFHIAGILFSGILF